MNFKLFADAINKKFLELSALGTLLRVNTSKEAESKANLSLDELRKMKAKLSK